MKNYFIKEGYIENSAVLYDTEDSRSSLYWTEDQIKRNYYTAYYVYKFAKELILKNKCSSILDIGCGVGIKLNKLIADFKIEIVGIDSIGAVKYCEENYNFGDFYSINFDRTNNSELLPNKRFDLILCSEVIEHLSDPDNLLSFIKRFSDMNTLIIISTPERDNTRGKRCYYSTNKYHVREWNLDEFKKYIESRGFDILFHRTIPPIKPFLSFYYLKHLIPSILFLNKYIYKGTQLALLQLKNIS